jgi:hypothetical protein
MILKPKSNRNQPLQPACPQRPMLCRHPGMVLLEGGGTSERWCLLGEHVFKGTWSLLCGFLALGEWFTPLCVPITMSAIGPKRWGH